MNSLFVIANPLNETNWRLSSKLALILHKETF